jgi:hypothetical protein
MVKIRNLIVPLVVVGTITLLPRVIIPKKKKKVVKNLKKDYDIDDDNLFI